MKYLLSWLLLIGGGYLVIEFSNWQTFVGIFLVLWSNNLDIYQRIGGKNNGD